jgi:hypothetical protein
MSRVYQTTLLSIVLLLGFTSNSSAQGAKTKTVTIINGDTTISESNMDEKDLAEMDKQINITINDDGNSSKKIVKKIIINDDKNTDKDGKTMAYAYSTDDDADIESIADDGNGATTKIIIKKGDGKSDSKEEKKVIHKSVVKSSDKMPKENMNINVKGTNATVDIETGSKEPMNVSVLDENGKQVFYDSQKTGGKYSKEIKLEKKGTYFLNFIQNKASTTEKIIVE